MEKSFSNRSTDLGKYLVEELINNDIAVAIRRKENILNNLK